MRQTARSSSIAKTTFFSSVTISVNITPNTRFVSYQPVISVSAIDEEIALAIVVRTFRLLLDGRESPVLTSIKTNLFPDRSVRFLSIAISLPNEASSKSPVSDPETGPRATRSPTIWLFAQGIFTTHFPCARTFLNARCGC